MLLVSTVTTWTADDLAGVVATQQDQKRSHTIVFEHTGLLTGVEAAFTIFLRHRVRLGAGRDFFGLKGTGAYQAGKPEFAKSVNL